MFGHKKTQTIKKRQKRASKSKPYAPLKKASQNIPHSKEIPVGRTLQTRDEYLASGKGKKNIKPDHPDKKDLYRRVGVIGSNSNGDAAIVKLSTKGRHKLDDYSNGKTRYNAYIETKDNKGRRIRVDGKKFKENGSERDLSKNAVEQIKENCLRNAETSKSLRDENLKRYNRIVKP